MLIDSRAKDSCHRIHSVDFLEQKGVILITAWHEPPEGLPVVCAIGYQRTRRAPEPCGAQLCSRPERASRANSRISSNSVRSSRAAEMGDAVVITLVRLWERQQS